MNTECETATTVNSDNGSDVTKTESGLCLLKFDEKGLFRCRNCTKRDPQTRSSEIEYFCELCIANHIMKGHVIVDHRGYSPIVCDYAFINSYVKCFADPAKLYSALNARRVTANVSISLLKKERRKSEYIRKYSLWTGLISLWSKQLVCSENASNKS